MIKEIWLASKLNHICCFIDSENETHAKFNYTVKVNGNDDLIQNDCSFVVNALHVFANTLYPAIHAHYISCDN